MDDWDTPRYVKPEPRETVVRGKAALNSAARRGAIVNTEKKYATSNAVCLPRPFVSLSTSNLPYPRGPQPTHASHSTIQQTPLQCQTGC